jgi:hypothetical protein
MLWNHGARLISGTEGEFLCRAVQNGDIEMLQSLLKYGANVNSTSFYGCTPLQMAISVGKLEFVTILIEQGAEVSEADEMELAKKQMHKEAIDLWVKKQTECGPGKGISNPTLGEEKILDEDITLATSAMKEKHAQPKGRAAANYDKSLSRLLSSKCRMENKVKKDGLIRVTLYQHHPRGSHSVMELGRLITVPSSLEELLLFASKCAILSQCSEVFLDLAFVWRLLVYECCHWKCCYCVENICWMFQRWPKFPCLICYVLCVLELKFVFTVFAGKTEEEFMYSPVKILTEDLAEVKSISVLRDGDVIFAVDNEELGRIFGGLQH